ncbi:MAG: zinc ribbon domain-containing protein [Bacteroidetes bacterium]|nr:zinc ribbon domain-containing protein [Bacteroidota bacterium]
MFCSQCGKEASGNFCAHCGAALQTGTPAHQATKPWQEEKTIPELLANSEVRTLVRHFAAKAKKHLDAGDYFSTIDKIFKPGGISFKAIADVAVPIFGKLGIHTDHALTKVLALSLHEAILRGMCVLAQKGWPIAKIDLAENGIVINATIPSDLFTWTTDLWIHIEGEQQQARISLSTSIKGQLYDWGKSKRAMNRILDEMGTINLNEKFDGTYLP